MSTVVEMLKQLSECTEIAKQAMYYHGESSTSAERDLAVRAMRAARDMFAEVINKATAPRQPEKVDTLIDRA